MPALASLRASFPNARITWFVRPEFAPLLENIPGLDEVMIFDRKSLGKWWRDPKAFSELAKLIARLRDSKFDMVIDLQGLFRTAMFAWLSGSKKRFGLRGAREFASVFYTHKIDVDSSTVHVIDIYEKIIASTGASEIRCNYNLSPTKDAVDSVKELLTERGLNYGEYVVFVPSAAHSHKCWPTEYFADLAGRIAADFDLPVIAVGTKGESPIIEEINSQAKTDVLNLAGLTNVDGLVALLNGGRLIVTNDTGPGHIAVGLGRPTVMIFGPTNPARIKPYDRPDAVVAVEPDERGSQIDSYDPKFAIDQVSVDMVFEKVVIHLQEQQSD